MPKMSGAGRRATTYIAKRTVQSGFRAFDFAAAIGQPLNTYVVVILRDDATQHPSATVSKLVHKYRDWLANLARKTGVRTAPIYVHTMENPGGNAHVNWAVRVPPGREVEFATKLHRWVERVQGPVGPFDIRVQPIAAAYAKRLAKYVFKGASPGDVRHFHLQDVHEPQGTVHGKRTGISRSIGAKVRRRVGFHPGRRSYGPAHVGGSSRGQGKGHHAS